MALIISVTLALRDIESGLVTEANYLKTAQEKNRPLLPTVESSR